ncbi:cytochrome o ubiquinol oxidase subunit IV [Candidatus Saccharibacteria bacterium]|nr:cytochrome o ubiquinol oxidase subunit IV [Candidatus Saccharibacteria bacterium]
MIAPKPNLRNSNIGLVTSLVLTLTAYVFVVEKYLSGWLLTGFIAVLAILQLFVQFRFFLHIGEKISEKAKTKFLMFSILCVSIIVFGSIWIMNNLNYNMMHNPESVQNIIDDELIHH